MTNVETNNRTYYFIKFGSLLLGLIFLLAGVLLAPFLIMGLASTLVSAWMFFKCHRVRIDKDYICKKHARGEKCYDWDSIEKISAVNFILDDLLFRVKPKNEKAFLYTFRRKETMLV